VEIVFDCNEHGVDCAVFAVSQMVASHSMLGLEISDRGLDRSTQLEFARTDGLA
jgi:hypothetical protein